MTDIQHTDITGSDAVHPSDFYQSSDPGAVGPNKSWKDTTTTPPIQKRRNAADAGWDTVLDPSLYVTKATLTLLGDLFYASGVSTPARLAGNTVATRKFLRQTGTGVASAAPAWDTLVSGDIPTLDASIIGTGTFGTTFIPSLPTSKITSGKFATSFLNGVESAYYMSHVNGGGSLEVWYCLGQLMNLNNTTQTFAANQITAYPFVAPARGGTLDRIAFNVTTAVAGNARVGIYDATSDSNLYPNALVVDGGSISTGTTGIKSATISVALTPGKLYWCVSLADAASSVRALSAGSGNNILGYDNTLVTNPNRSLQAALTFGALPGTFPAGAGTATANPPAAFVRYSA
jgi:hypothetical protein